MATRLYLPSTGSPGVAGLAYGTGWTRTGSSNRIAGARTKSDSADTTRAATSTATSPEFHCLTQFQFPGLSAQTISGTLKGQVRCITNNVSFQGTLAITARIVAVDGITIRDHLIGPTPAAPPPGTTPPEFTISTSNRKFKTSAGVSDIPITTVTTNINDILVIEIGVRDEDTGTSRSGSLRFQDLIAASDLPENETATSAFNPWVEFTADLAFVADESAPTLTQHDFWYDGHSYLGVLRTATPLDEGAQQYWYDGRPATSLYGEDFEPPEPPASTFPALTLAP